MTYGDLVTITPLTIMGISSILLLLFISIRRNHLTVFALSLIGFGISFISLFTGNYNAPEPAAAILVMDQFGVYFMGLIIILSAIVSTMVYIYFKFYDDHKEELYPLITISAMGAMVLAASDHFVSLFLGLEILTISLYVMIGYLRQDNLGLEAGIKYLVLAAAASAFLVLGMALIYAEKGNLGFAALSRFLMRPESFRSAYILAGTGLIVVGAGFKLGVVPFHMWTPDVYQGASSPVTAFIASVSKTAMVALLIRFLLYTDFGNAPIILFIMGIISLLSMVLGNLLAITQSNIKRLLAYSSIAHLGYILVGLVAFNIRAFEAVIFYITVYSLTITGAFGVIAFVSKTGDETDAIESYRGLFWRRPYAAAILAVILFSLAGIPLTAGFIGKYFIVLSGLDKTLWTLIFILIVTSVIGLYYYLRVIAVMIDIVEEKSEKAITAFSPGKALVLFIIAVLIILYGIHPGPLIALIRRALQASFM